MHDATPRGPRRGSLRRRRDLLCLAAGAVLLVAAVWAFAAPTGNLDASAGAVPGSPAAATPSAALVTPTTAGSDVPRTAVVADPAQVPVPHPPTAAFVPTRLRIPSLSVDSRVVPEDVRPGGEIGIPEDPAVLGWWRGGGQPGSGVGSVVVVGHVDSARYGTGPLYRAVRLRVGDQAVLSAANGTTRTYRLVALRTYLKATLPADQIFSQQVDERLVVVTCGGQYHRGQGGWDSNVVAYFVRSSP